MDTVDHIPSSDNQESWLEVSVIGCLVLKNEGSLGTSKRECQSRETASERRRVTALSWKGVLESRSQGRSCQPEKNV